jgi:hypothetical protein
MRDTSNEAAAKQRKVHEEIVGQIGFFFVIFGFFGG